MSATGRGGDRLADDFYSTPAWCAHAILRSLQVGIYVPVGEMIRPMRVLDPCAGDGSMMRVARGVGCEVSGIEIDEARAKHASQHGVVRLADALGKDPWPATDLVLMNPPYTLAMPFVARALAEVRAGGGIVAVLLRLPWLASQGRAAFHRDNPSNVKILPRRPEFAASMKCKAKCGYAEMLPIAAERPTACPKCGGKLTTTTTDATDYAWFVWEPDSGGQWEILESVHDG